MHLCVCFSVCVSVALVGKGKVGGEGRHFIRDGAPPPHYAGSGAAYALALGEFSVVVI